MGLVDHALMNVVFQVQQGVGFSWRRGTDFDAAGLLYGFLDADGTDDRIITVRNGLLQQFGGLARIGLVLFVAAAQAVGFAQCFIDYQDMMAVFQAGSGIFEHVHNTGFGQLFQHDRCQQAGQALVPGP